MSAVKVSRPQSTFMSSVHSVYAALVQFPVVCFTLALLTDLAYWQTSYLMWTEFSAWLLLAGIVTGGVAAVFGAVDLLTGYHMRTAWPHAVGGALVLILAFINNLVHAADGWTSVVPWGLTLSALTVLIIVATAAVGGVPYQAHDVRVHSHDH